MPINGIAVGSVAVGSLLIWSGVKGWNLTATIGQVITGKVPSGSNVYPLANAGDGTSGGGVTATGSALLTDFQKYNGHQYVYGGAPGKSGTNGWDCSSSINWVVGHDANHAIPGYAAGQYDGSVHGPPTGSWGIWPGLQHVSPSNAQPGDIIVWTGHMAMFVSGNLQAALNGNPGAAQMFSALDTAEGTKQSTIEGNGPLMCVGRLT
ncbi:MAG TPA: NlpC/P60 family protein [Bacteroidia bacterium]